MSAALRRSLLPAARAAWRDGAKRAMSSGASHEEEIAEMKKWRTITIAAIPLCGLLAAYNLSGHHEEEAESPPYSYLRIRNKDFPWGKCGLFEFNCKEE
eukprot:jgi/Pico_ML_1/54933/g70.t1